MMSPQTGLTVQTSPRFTAEHNLTADTEGEDFTILHHVPPRFQDFPRTPGTNETKREFKSTACDTVGLNAASNGRVGLRRPVTALQLKAQQLLFTGAAEHNRDR